MSRPPGPLGRLSPPRRRMWLGVAALVSGVVLVPLAVQALEADPVVTVDQARPGPVLLVPGYGGSTDSLRFLASYLEDRGRDVEVVEPVGDGTGDLRDQAERLDEVVARTLERTGAESVDLVGYSAGGVVVRIFLAERDGTEVTRRAVSLGSPHHGTDLAALAGGIAGGACPEACLQLDPDSDLLLELNRGDETPDGPLYTSIWTEDDQTVVPASSGRLDGALDYAVQDVCPEAVISHGDLPSTSTTILMVASALGTREPRLPDASVCDQGISFVG